MFNKELKNQITKLQNEKDALLLTISKLKSDKESLSNELYNISDELSTLKKYNISEEIKQKKLYLKELQSSIEDIESSNYIQTLGFYELKYDSKYYKEELKDNRRQQKTMLSNKSYFTIKEKWYINGNAKDGGKLIDFFVNICMTSFNLYCDSILDTTNIINSQYIQDKIKRIYNNYNNELMKHGVELSNEYFQLKIDEIKIRLNIYIAKENEKEEENRRKEILKEQIRAEKEIEQNKVKLEKKMLYLLAQKNKGADTDEEIEELQKQLDNDDYMLTNSKSGYVYIISNPSLGKDIYKIGLTRRTEYQHRIDELSGSNIPFKFRPNCIIWSDDCFKLESDLHHEFDKYRVNKIKLHREFFKLPLSEIEKIVKEKYCQNAIFEYDVIDDDFIASGYDISENFIDKTM